MKIPGYTYVTHKIISRPWGPECRYTVSRDGIDINDVVMLSSVKADDQQVCDQIVARLAVIDAPKPVDDEPVLMYSETEVVDLLVQKGYLTTDECLADLKTATEFTKSKDPIEEAK
jgi:hypothetical protein